MKFIAKFAEFVGYHEFDEERSNSWTCPNRFCGMPIIEDYRYCPFCGQKVKYKLPKGKLKMIAFSMTPPANVHARLTSYDQNGEVVVNEEETFLRNKGCYDKDEMYKIMMHLAEQLAKYEDAYFGKDTRTSGISIQRGNKNG